MTYTFINAAGKAVPERTAGVLRHRRAAALVGSLLLSLLTSCQDGMAGAGGITAISQPASGNLVGDPDATNWNAFDMDVVMRFTMVMSADSSEHPGGLAFHVHKRRDPDGRWLSDIALADDAPIVNGPAERDPNAVPHIGRVNGISRTTMPTFVNTAGMEVPSRTITFEPPRKGPGWHPRKRPAPPETHRPMPPTRGRVHADTTREWLDRFILTPQGAHRLRKRLEASGMAAQMSGGRSRFAQRRGDADVEIIVDDHSGRMLETRISRRGELHTRVELDYAEAQAGIWILRSERISHYRNGAQQSPRTMVVSYSNVRLTEER